ncbi:MAG: DUF2326 domain-containing protein [Candidatus Falkowbacteria bacterium]
MKINKIYSNNKLMDPIPFNPGFNVVYGDVENKQGGKNEHSIGKTSLVHLIDFLLLKKITKKHFLYKYKDKFKDWVFYIEIRLDENRFLTIKRPVDTPTLISFKEHSVGDQDFSSMEEWDQKDTKLMAKKGSDSLFVLEKYLNFTVLQKYSVRHFLAYALRTQYDYEDIFKMRQFEGLDIDWKPQLFGLLGYKDDDVIDKYRVQYEIKNYKNLLKTTLGNKKNNTGDAYNLKAAIAEKENEKRVIVHEIDKFNFYLKEKKLNKKLIEETELKISRLNSERYRLDFEIQRIQESLKNNITFDINEVEEVFKQAKIFFPNELKKNYEDLLNFNIRLSAERSKYLREDLKANIECIEKINRELKNINQEKDYVLAFLRNTDTFSKYKSLQNDVFKIDEQINQFKLKLESLGTAENYEKKIGTLRDESREIAIKIKEIIDGGSKTFDLVNSIFKDIFKKTMDHTALLIVKPNQEGNPDFEPITLNDKDKDQLTGQGDGYTATKVQCSAFVLAILAAYSKEHFFRFAYHDGLVESWGDRPKINFFKEIKEICAKYDIQYTISVIKSDVPDNFKFEEGDIVTTLTHEKPLFGFDF